MQTFSFNSIGVISKNKKELEKKLSVKISVKGKNASISGDETDVYAASFIMIALSVGFSLKSTLLLKDENYMLQHIDIRNITRRKNLEDVRARIIGKDGTVLRTLSALTECDIVLHDNIVYLIGRSEDIAAAIDAVESLIRGIKHASIYSGLERKRAKKEEIEDFGMRENVGE